MINELTIRISLAVLMLGLVSTIYRWTMRSGNRAEWRR